MSSLALFMPVNWKQGEDDADLLERARRGDAEAFCLLCRGWEHRLLRQAVLLTGRDALAEVLARETLVEAWRGLARFDGRSQFFTWLCAILIRRHRNAQRALRLWDRFFVSDDGSSSSTDSNPTLHRAVEERPDPAEQLAERERRAQVRRCLDRLPPKQRDVVYLRYFVDHSLESIASALDCSLGTVKSRLHHALEKLRDMREMNGLHSLWPRNTQPVDFD